MTNAASLTRRAALGAPLAGPVPPRLAIAEATPSTRDDPVMPDERLRCRFADQDFTCRLLHSATTRDLLSRLRLGLTLEDVSANGTIAHLPRRLDEGGHVAFDHEAPEDLCGFLGWGNLALLHDACLYQGDPTRLGRIDGGVGPLPTRGAFPLRLERMG